MRPRIFQDLTRRRRPGGTNSSGPRSRGLAARWACWGCLLLCPLVLAAGCKKARTSSEHADVSGKVTYNGRAVPGGRVTFVTPDGFASTGNIDEDGHYKISAPVGDVKIGVDNKMLKNVGHAAATRGAAGPGAKMPDAKEPEPIKGKFIQIPTKSADPQVSGLTYTVKKGAQEHDIELKD
jgi:hypothetical protein